MNKKAIVTGANGFVGSHLVKNLADSGIEVTAVVRNSKSDISAISNFAGVNIVYCDLNHIEQLSEFLDNDYEYFFHFAWEASAGVDRGNADVQLNNIAATCKAVETAKLLGCKRFIFAASIMAYEAKEYINKDFASPTPAYIYSTAKLTAAMMAKTVAIKNDIEYIDTVISNIYGAGEKSMRFLNTMVHKILSGEELNLTSCEQSYDFIYVTDAAEQIKISALKGENLCSYYIGNEKQYPLKDFVTAMRDAINKDVKINFGAVAFSGTYFNYSNVIDTHKTFRFGYKPKVCFNDGIKMLANSIKKEAEL